MKIYTIISTDQCTNQYICVIRLEFILYLSYLIFSTYFVIYISLVYHPYMIDSITFSFQLNSK